MIIKNKNLGTFCKKNISCEFSLIVHIDDLLYSLMPILVIFDIYAIYTICAVYQHKQELPDFDLELHLLAKLHFRKFGKNFFSRLATKAPRSDDKRTCKEEKYSIGLYI